MASHSSVDTLVKMANQIGDFFGSQKSADRAAGIMEHIQRFWDPRMRANIIAHVAHGGDGLSPLVLEAVQRLAKKSPENK